MLGSVIKLQRSEQSYTETVLIVRASYTFQSTLRRKSQLRYVKRSLAVGRPFFKAARRKAAPECPARPDQRSSKPAGRVQSGLHPPLSTATRCMAP